MSHFQIIFFATILLLLIIISGFFSMSETALMAVNRYRVRHQARLKKRYAVRILQLLKRPDRVLGVILIGNTFANILASSLATLIAYHFWGDEGALLAAIILTFVVLIFSEIAPKTVAAIYPDQVSRWIVYPVQVILKLFYPIVVFANMIANGLLKLLNVRVTSSAIEPLSREEIRSVVYDARGKISRQYQNMLLAILDMNKLMVGDVMIPRHEIIGIDIEKSWEAIVIELNKINHEWVPFYRNHINQVIGVLYARDIYKILLARNVIDKEILQQFLQEPYFVPEGTLLSVQLNYFQQGHEKIAFVVDEYGEMQGMLTMNDILEEIIGDFNASMIPGKHIQLQTDGSYLVDGATTVREFNRIADFELPLHGPRTINGLITEYLQALPHAGTAVLITSYPIEIIQVKDNRVKLARVFPQLAEKGL
ncbi:MAG: hypothetical protein ACD_46C00663G0004 [uncultured bacterium]|nr:MAG: hypothetical protein ACD_46C00663G0004 [uncultured bacterium]